MSKQWRDIVLVILHLFCPTPRPALHLEPWETETTNCITWAACQMACLYLANGKRAGDWQEERKGSISSALSFCFGVSAPVMAASLNNGSCLKGTPLGLWAPITLFFHPFVLSGLRMVVACPWVPQLFLLIFLTLPTSPFIKAISSEWNSFLQGP